MKRVSNKKFALLKCKNPQISPLGYNSPLKFTIITMHMYSCETTWLEKALQDITGTRSTVVIPTL